ncbi:MAG: HlyD family efflux transporter periplasmic adaptor subunit [Hyphomicrobiales bacterium]|nr:HlyD family efflux transporter periplasmic adaptor subunit [Hyphomicrobiales bacterium]
MWPKPVFVDIAEIGRETLEVTVEDEGVTRIRDVYTVSAPVPGKVLRSPREIGDTVIADETLVAVIEPTDPTFLDARSQRVAEAAVSAAEAAVNLAAAQVREANSQLDFAKSDLERAERLADRKTISERSLEKARLDVATAEANLARAIATEEVRKRELESARAQLIQPGETSTTSASCCVQVRAPVNGRVLTIMNESEQVVQAGTPLIEIGDPADLEIVVDLLSRDAVRVAVDAPARIDGWGGGLELKGIVTRIDPAAFTKVSALGIEEQRVKTVLKITSPHAEWKTLGHGFRVVARIVVARAENTLAVPLAALFRQGEDWAVFRVIAGRAVLTPVEIGERNLHIAEVKSGLAEGDRVILHPSDSIGEDVEVALRDDGGEAKASTAGK